MKEALEMHNLKIRTKAEFKNNNQIINKIKETFLFTKAWRNAKELQDNFFISKTIQIILHVNYRTAVFYKKKHLFTNNEQF